MLAFQADPKDEEIQVCPGLGIDGAEGPLKGGGQSQPLPAAGRSHPHPFLEEEGQLPLAGLSGGFPCGISVRSQQRTLMTSEHVPAHLGHELAEQSQV